MTWRADGPQRDDLAPRQPTKSALGTSRGDNVTGKGARSFGNPRPEPRAPVFNAGFQAQEGSDLRGKFADGKRPDATLADSLSPQLGLGFDVEVVGAKPPDLADKFIVPPFSVLDTRAGYWQDRRRAWLSIGFRGETIAEQARDETESESESIKTGTSVFDPVLCEVVYRWFSGEGGQVLDPFAGGVVRGAVAAILGRRYWGCELRPEQIVDNRRQADDLFGPDGLNFGRTPEVPVWHEGDATKLREYAPPAADLVFTCPPYGDLEVYSDDPRDLSTMTYEEFRWGLLAAMEASTEALRPHRFAVWVVGEFRDKDGMEAGYISDTVQLAMRCGLRPYNSAILLNSVGSAALRAQRTLRSRKLTRIHQHVLVFCKGDPKRAAAACGTAEVDS